MFVAYAALIALASLNRETGLIIALIYMAYFADEWRFHVKRFLCLILVWGAAQGAIHLALGAAPHMLGAGGTLEYNLAMLPHTLFANLLFLPLIGLGAAQYRFLSPIFKRLLWAAGLYTLAILIGGAWDESQRLILPILPLYLAGVLCHTKSDNPASAGVSTKKTAANEWAVIPRKKRHSLRLTPFMPMKRKN